MDTTIRLICSLIILAGVARISSAQAPTTADLSIEKAALDSDALPAIGLRVLVDVEDVVYSIDVTNNGPAAATGVTVTDLLPSGLEIIEGSWTASGGTFEESTGIWSVGTLDVGETAGLSFPVRATALGTKVNTASVTANEADPNPNNNQATASIVVYELLADLSVNKEVSGPDGVIAQRVTLSQGEAALFGIEVTNNGPDQASGVVLTDLLPDGEFQLSDVIMSTGTYDSATGAWAIGELAVGETVALSLVVIPSGPGEWVNEASVAGDQTDPVSGNNASTATLESLPIADLLVEKQVLDEDANPTSSLEMYIGENEALFAIDVTNLGPDATTEVQVVDLLPSGLGLVAGGWTASAGEFDETTGTWTLGDLAAGEMAGLSFPVTGTELGLQLNTATVSGYGDDPDLSNNAASASVEVIERTADLGLHHEAFIGVETPSSQIAASPGDIVDLGFELENLGPDDASGVVLTHILPLGLTFRDIAYVSVGAYDETTGLWSVGSLAAGQVAVLHVTVVADEAGSWTSEAEASADQTDPDSGNNESAVDVTVGVEESPSIDLILVPLPGGTFTMGESELAYEGPPGSYDAALHEVTLSAFEMSEAEVTNQQYVDFLNAALAEGLVEVLDAPAPPDLGKTIVYGTQSAPEEYRGAGLLNLSGTRVMKDHADNDDDDEFTGVIEPENPLNIAYVGYDETRPEGDWFYVKDPQSADDFDWQALTTYYNYTNVTLELDTSVELNDYDDWEELADFPNNMPTQADVRDWPATFIRWWGAKAFAMYYDLDLPTEAEWEYAAQGGAAFQYATDDGLVDGDGTSANWNHLEANPSRGHVDNVKRGEPNPYGLYNLAGNVWEWVDDWYGADFYSDSTNPVNTEDTGVKVRRGGAWNYHLSTLKAAARAQDERFKGNDHFGFRVVNRDIESIAPDWTVNATAFDESMSILGAVTIGGVELTGTGDMLAAFAGSEVRGVATPDSIGGRLVFSLVVYAAAGEAPYLTFQAYDASTGVTSTLPDEFPFEADAVFGSATAPYAFGEVTDNNLPNWILDTTGYASSMEFVAMAFSDGLSFAAGDTLAAFIDGQLRGVAPAEDNSGQIVFPLTVFGNSGDGSVSFKLFDAVAEQVNDLTEEVDFAAGSVLGSTQSPIGLNVGVLTSPPTWEDEFADLQTAGLSRMTVVAAVYVEGFRDDHPDNLLVARVFGQVRGVASPTYVDGKAVYTLDVFGDTADDVQFSAFAFDPTDGVQKQFVLPKSMILTVGPPVGNPAQPVTMDTRDLTEKPSLWTGFEAPASHTATMAINGALTVESMYLGETLLENVIAQHPDDMVAAYIGDDLRGVAASAFIGGAYTFPLTVYSDSGDVSTVTFKAYFAAADEVIDLSEEATFVEGGTLGMPGQVFWEAGPIAPGFEVASDDTEGVMNVSGEVVVESAAGKAVDDAKLVSGDEVLAYVGDSIRGIATLQESTGGSLIFEAEIAGNAGDPVYFKTFSKDSNSFFVVDEMVPFSPGGRVGDPGNPTRLTASRPVQVDLRVYLEGAFDEQQGRMRTYLAEQDLLPLEQPYKGEKFAGTKLAHPGEEALLAVPPGAVDWVLVDLRTDTTPGSRVATRAGILLSDGRVIHPDGASPVRLLDLPAGEYYIVVRHRNHLPVISASAVTLGTEPVRYDFGKASSQAAGFNAQVSLGSGIFGMFAGDANVSGGISPGDAEAWQSANGTAGYFFADFDLSGGVTATDYALWLSNLGLRTQVRGF